MTIVLIIIAVGVSVLAVALSVRALRAISRFLKTKSL